MRGRAGRRLRYDEAPTGVHGRAGLRLRLGRLAGRPDRRRGRARRRRGPVGRVLGDGARRLEVHAATLVGGEWTDQVVATSGRATDARNRGPPRSRDSAGPMVAFVDGAKDAVDGRDAPDGEVGRTTSTERRRGVWDSRGVDTDGNAVAHLLHDDGGVQVRVAGGDGPHEDASGAAPSPDDGNVGRRRASRSRRGHDLRGLGRRRRGPAGRGRTATPSRRRALGTRRATARRWASRGRRWSCRLVRRRRLRTCGSGPGGPRRAPWSRQPDRPVAT